MHYGFRVVSLSLSLSVRERNRQTERDGEREREKREREKDVCVCPAAGRQELTPPASFAVAVRHEQAHEHARVLGSVPLSTFNSCEVPINPCPMSMFTSSSSSFSPLSRGLEHQTQLPIRLCARARAHTRTHTHTASRPRVH